MMGMGRSEGFGCCVDKIVVMAAIIALIENFSIIFGFFIAEEFAPFSSVQ